jgi:hypothetical protein
MEFKKLLALNPTVKDKKSKLQTPEVNIYLYPALGSFLHHYCLNTQDNEPREPDLAFKS